MQRASAEKKYARPSHAIAYALQGSKGLSLPAPTPVHNRPIQLKRDKLSFYKPYVSTQPTTIPRDISDKYVVETDRGLQAAIQEVMDRHKAIAKAYSKLAQQAYENLSESLENRQRQWKANYDMAGWDLDALLKDIATNKELKIEQVSEGAYNIRAIESGRLLMTIYTGKELYAPADVKETARKVFVKQGSDPLSREGQKNYIQDDSDQQVMIPRYATRAFTPDQLISLVAGGRMAPRNAAVSIQDIRKTFYLPESIPDPQSFLRKNKPFFQLRSGSGDNQPQLSITHTSKTIFGNAGLPFDKGSKDFGGTMMIDLAQMPKSTVFNLYKPEALAALTGFGKKRISSDRGATTAEEELGMGKASAERNRETTLEYIPENAIIWLKDQKGTLIDLKELRRQPPAPKDEEKKKEKGSTSGFTRPEFNRKLKFLVKKYEGREHELEAAFKKADQAVLEQYQVLLGHAKPEESIKALWNAKALEALNQQ